METSLADAFALEGLAGVREFTSRPDPDIWRAPDSLLRTLRVSIHQDCRRPNNEAKVTTRRPEPDEGPLTDQSTYGCYQIPIPRMAGTTPNPRGPHRREEICRFRIVADGLPAITVALADPLT